MIAWQRQIVHVEKTVAAPLDGWMVKLRSILLTIGISTPEIKNCFNSGHI